MRNKFGAYHAICLAECVRDALRCSVTLRAPLVACVTVRSDARLNFVPCNFPDASSHRPFNPAPLIHYTPFRALCIRVKHAYVMRSVHRAAVRAGGPPDQAPKYPHPPS